MTLIKKRRLELKRSQMDMAILCDVSLMSYQLWERGVTTPSERNRKKLIQTLSLPHDYFDKK